MLRIERSSLFVKVYLKCSFYYALIISLWGWHKYYNDNNIIYCNYFLHRNTSIKMICCDSPVLRKSNIAIHFSNYLDIDISAILSWLLTKQHNRKKTGVYNDSVGKDERLLASEQSSKLKTNTYDINTGDMQDIVLEFCISGEFGLLQLWEPHLMFFIIVNLLITFLTCQLIV